VHTVVVLRRQNTHPAVKYELQSYNDETTDTCSGGDLTNGKLLVEIGDRPGSRLYRYKRMETSVW
jgi:hypothetical protein